MKIAIFAENFLGSSGGAEVYALKLAEALSDENEIIIVAEKNAQSIKDIGSIFKKYNSKEFPVMTFRFSHKKNIIIDTLNRIILWAKLQIKVMKKFDVFVNCYHNRLIASDKILSIHLVHFPYRNYQRFFPGVVGKKLDDWYRKSYFAYISNSEFTKYHLKKEWNVDSTIINPPIDMIPVDEDVLKNKKKQILIVGRLVPDKKIKEMLAYFSSVKEKCLLSEYEMIVVGNKDNECFDYYEYLKSLEKESNGKIKILNDISHDELIQKYQESEFFWHAKGYLEDENTNPMLMEHFGMTTVEAMANGCVPIVINKAGQREIVDDKLNGFLWDNIEQIYPIMNKILCDKNLLHQIQINAVEKSKKYLIDGFNARVKDVFSKFVDEYKKSKEVTL